MKNIIDKLNKEELAHPLDEQPLYHKNCAEIMLMAANEQYNLGLDERFFKAVCPFGGGFQTENTCGALLGALAAIGLMYTEERPTTNDKMKEKTKQFVAEFEKEFGALDCANIKAHHRSETEGCAPVKIRTAEVFERVIND
ncbi:putative redox-active protein [anaerobic digester metagenome]